MIIEIDDEALINIENINIKGNWRESCYYWHKSFRELKNQLKNNTQAKGDAQ